jgi:hypothetical protein
LSTGSPWPRSAGRVQFRGAEANLSHAIRRIEAGKRPGDKQPAWQRALATARPPLYDVHWTPAIVLEKPTGTKGQAWRVGLTDGRIVPLAIDNAAAQRKLTLHSALDHQSAIAEGGGGGSARGAFALRGVGGDRLDTCNRLGFPGDLIDEVEADVTAWPLIGYECWQ